MTSRRLHIAILFIAVCLAAAAPAQQSRRIVGVVSETPSVSIPDFALLDRLYDALATYADFDVIMPGEDSSTAETPNDRFNLPRLADWGQQHGCRYLLYLQVESRRIVTDKQLSIPFVLSRYVVRGRLTGTYILIDTQRRKAINTWNLCTTVGGPRQWQVFDDYRDDPDLQLSASEKIAFLRRLETKAAAEIIGNIVPLVRGH